MEYKMHDIDNLLRAVNLAHLDGLKTVEISMEDLKTLQREIKVQEQAISVLKKDNHLLRVSLAQSQLKVLEKPLMKLRCYC